MDHSARPVPRESPRIPLPFNSAHPVAALGCPALSRFDHPVASDFDEQHDTIDHHVNVCAEYRLPVAYLPKDLPRRNAVNGYFLSAALHHALDVKCRERAERETSATASGVDNWTANGTMADEEKWCQGRNP